MKKPQIAPKRPIIQTEALVKAFGLLPVLRNISIDIAHGQFVALLGPNGSGKSTLLSLLAGLSRPTAGRVIIGGWELPDEAIQIRHQIGMVSHKALLYENLTAYENLKFFSQLYNLPQDNLDDHIKSLLDKVGLSRRSNSLARTFSRGMQQRLSIARALLHNPQILLFDEPYTGLDQQAGTTLDELFAEAMSGGRTIIMATHQLERAVNLADRVIIISKGKVGYDSPTAGLTPSQLTTDYADITGTITSR